MLHRVDVRLVIVVTRHLAEGEALIVHAAYDRDRRGFRLARAKMMAFEDVVDGAAVGDDVALEVPLAAEGVLQQELAWRRPVRR